MTEYIEETDEEFETRMLNQGRCPHCIGKMIPAGQTPEDPQEICEECGYVDDPPW